MRGLAQARWVAGAAVLALTVAACGGEDPATPGDTSSPDTTSGGESPSEPAAVAGGTLRTNLGEPAFLTPAGGNDSESIEVLTTLYSMLVDYNKDGTIYPVVAAEIPTSEDNQTWTITLNEGWTFHDGTPVTANSFVDAWNATAYGPSAHNNGYFFGPGIAYVEGFDDLQSVDPDGEEGPQTAPPPAAETMSGLEVVSDTEFTVTLTEPLSFFPLMLGYIAFAPLSEACLAAEDMCNESPIGNGPFQFESWTHEQQVAVTKYEEWAGESPPNIDGIEWNIYSDNQTAYLELQDGNLDFLAGVPPEEIQNAEAEFGPDRFIKEPSSSFTYIGFALYDDLLGGGTADDNFGGPEKVALRKALSMAIDRQLVIDTVFSGSFIPADSLIAPVVDGYREGACGDACVYDMAAAQEMWEANGGADVVAAGPLKLFFNGPDTPHAAWMEAVGNMWQAAFGLEFELVESPSFGEYLETQANQGFAGGVFRLGWGFDYPSAQSYLSPVYGPGAGADNFGYSDPEVDAILQDGNSAATIDEGVALYQEAEDMIFESFPNIPMWYGASIVAFNENVSGAELDLFGDLDYNTVSITEAS